MAGEPINAQPTWPDVTSFADGDHVNAEVLNTPLQQLAARTEHLRRLLQQVDHAKLTVVDAHLAADPSPKVGQVVYRTPDGTYAAARGDAGNNAWFYAAANAMAVGVVSERKGEGYGTVVLCGYVDFSGVAGGGVPVADVIADANPESGRYYLSSVAAGKLTAGPSGPVIYVCDCHIEDGRVTSMIVNPQYRDTGESHVHRSFVLDWKPQGGYSVLSPATGKYAVQGHLPKVGGVQQVPSPDGTTPGLLHMYLYGAWAPPKELADRQVAYTFTVTGSGDDWGGYSVEVEEGGTAVKSVPLGGLASAAGTTETSKYTGIMSVGSYGLTVVFGRTSNMSPSAAAGQSWDVTMPDDARGWVKNTAGGFKLNLGMYPAMARFVPPVPANSAALVVGGAELRGPEFPADRRQWRIDGPDGSGGPWLVWENDSSVGDGTSATVPWIHDGNTEPAKMRDIVLHVGRMLVGPTGFVTSLQAAPGSPLRVTSALTGESAVQGALQIGRAVGCRSAEGNAPGFQVVKQINGTTFVTGPVVERIVAGPGLSVNQEQGTVQISASNAVYAGDFETIALRNAKQDLAGGVFPYTKLLGWGAGTNVDSGFAAKFRVPDHIPYNAGRGYYVVVSASVFGEADSTSERTAAFSLVNYTLADQACSAAAPAAGFAGSIASPVRGLSGEAAVVNVAFDDSYTAFDPVLIHGFRTSADGSGPGQLVLPDTDTPQRRAHSVLWLKASSGAPVVVYPGYFVGIAIQRCATSGTAYTAPIGFMSLRWNLVEVPAS